MVAMADAASAGSTGYKHYKRSQFTAAQRAKILEIARQVCRKRYGAAATVYRLEYSPFRVTCLEG